MAYTPLSDSGSKCPGQIHSTGITEIYVPRSPVLDICFVHGFTGHPEFTWRSKKRTKRQAPSQPVSDTSSKRRLFGSRKKAQSSSSRESFDPDPLTTIGEYPYWPKDFVPQIIPDARVLTFGYDTHIRLPFSGPPSHNSLKDHSNDFLCALERCRSETPSRPLLFVAHSLGGLVVKDTLRQSKSYEQDRPRRALIYLNTVGIIFFGTPHSGADPLNTIHHCLVSLIKLLTFSVNDDIVELLKPSGERLDILNEEFLRMTRTRKWHIRSFQEELPHPLLGKKIVEDTSSRVNDSRHEITEHIHMNHVDMCRFDRLGDSEFRKVEATLRLMRDSIRENSPPKSDKRDDDHLVRSAKPTYQATITPEQRGKILEKLNFAGVDTRYVSLLGAAQGKTCQWLPESSIYETWQDVTKLAEHHGFLWIKGKPGAGKSTMMIYVSNRYFKTFWHLVRRRDVRLLQRAKKTLATSLVISFFFNARGDKLERSTEGMYRSLLIQLLQRLPGARLDPEALVPLLGMSNYNPWPIKALQQAFESVITSAGSLDLYCYVDALDECPEDEIREMVSFFEDVGEKALASDFTFHVCFSSRHYPHISIQKSLQFTLENEPDHTNDIRQYIHTKLKMTEQDKKQSIEDEVLERSANIFLWAALVVNILNKENDKGINHTLKRLKQIPDGLDELFKEILTRDNNNIDELVLCLQWILFAKRPLRPEELYFAVQLGSDSANSSYWDPNDTRSDMIGRFNLNVSKGLTEVTKKKPTVQFIHESVRDYLMRGNGLRTLLGRRRETAREIEGLSNEALKEVCLAQLRDQIETKVLIPDELPKAYSTEANSLRDEVKAKFPFLEYAIDHVLSHADSAQRGGIDQKSFLSSFSRQRWIKMDNLLQKYQTRRHSNDAPLIYLLAEHLIDHQSLGNLILIHPDRHLGLTLPINTERYNLPMSAALAWGNHDAIRTLAVEAAKQGTSPTDADGTLVSKIQEELSDLSRFKPDRENDRWGKLDGKTALVLLGSISLVEALHDEFLQDGRTFLNLRVHFPAMAFAQCIMRHEHWINIHDIEGHSALMFAVDKDLVDLAEYLLSRNVESNFRVDGYTPLYYAKSIEMARVLYEHGANPYNISPDGKSFLHRVAAINRSKTLSLLEYALGEMGIDICTTTGGKSFLSYAAAYYSVEIVRFLYNFGNAKIDSADDTGRTPLSHASETLNYAVVQYLLELGVKPCLSDKSGKTPLWYAVKSFGQGNMRTNVIRALLGNPLTNPNHADAEGRTPLSLAAQFDLIDEIQLLIKDSRINIAVKCKKGRTAISYAQENLFGGRNMLNVLFEMTSLDPDEPDFEGKTPLMYACGNWHWENIETLLATRKVNVNAKDINGWTPLWHHLHGKEGTNYQVRVSLRSLLKSKAVDPLVIVDGQTPLDFAKSRQCYLARSESRRETVEILSSYVREWTANRRIQDT